MESREVDRVLGRIKALREFAKENNNDLIESIVGQLIDSMCKYTKAVFHDERNKAEGYDAVRAKYNSREEYQAAWEEAEKTRKDEHNGLILYTSMADLLCKRNNIPPIYGKIPEQYLGPGNIDYVLDENNRAEVLPIRHGLADWAFDFVLSCAASINLSQDVDHRHSQEDTRKIGEALALSVKPVRDMIDKVTKPAGDHDDQEI